MKAGVKIGIILASVLVTPLIIGLFQPKERLVTEMDLIDKMYFFILADITNHWEESVLLITQKTTETDYIRIIHKPDGRQLMRVITLADYKGKTAIRMSEEVYVANPVKRFINLFADPTKKRIRNYLNDLKEKNKPDPNAEQVDSF